MRFFILDTVNVCDSEMQSNFRHFMLIQLVLVRTFNQANDPNLLLTIRGRKYTFAFDFYVGKHKIIHKRRSSFIVDLRL